MDTKKIIVTGGAGFIGSHLTERLLEDGHRVRVLDNLSSGRLENLSQLKDNPNFSFIQTDISELNHIIDYFKGIDWVIHLAALADIVPSVVEPYKYHRANVSGTISVLEACRLNGVKRFIYAASSSCYGIPESFPTAETARIKPMYPYALTKYLGEEYVLHWSKLYKLPAISLRLFNVYGPRSRTSGAYGAVFGVFLAQKLSQRPFTVVGDGQQSRDFIFVTDVVQAFLCALESDITTEVFNVGSGNTYSINYLVSLLKGEVTYIPKRPGEPDCTYADITKIQRSLDWKPKVSFQEGVSVLVENINYWQKAPVWTTEAIQEATRDWFKYLH